MRLSYGAAARPGSMDNVPGLESPGLAISGTVFVNENPSQAPATQSRIQRRNDKRSVARPPISSPEPNVMAPSTSSLGATANQSSSVLQIAPLPPPKPRRRRRAAQSTNWIPESLKFFDLTPLKKSTQVPLPPVQPYNDPRTQQLIEERNSYEESGTDNPYHPDGWRGRLPGPAWIPEESSNFGSMRGALLVF